ncbi:MAG: Crp/Fnr family transcriptional regulator [Betaproteobacteria bacterium]
MSAAERDRLPKPLLDAIAARGGTRQFPAHAILINEGDATDSLYIVLTGRVKVYGSGESGRGVVFGEMGPGEYFGELSLDGAPRSASVMTTEPTTCSVVSGAQLREFIAQHPDLAIHLTGKLIHTVRRLTEQVKSLALRDVYGRVVGVLSELSEPDGDRRIVHHRLTQQDIADRVGSSREMVSRIFKDLTIGGYVSVLPDRRIVIHKKPPPAW